MGSYYTRAILKKKYVYCIFHGIRQFQQHLRNKRLVTSFYIILSHNFTTNVCGIHLIIYLFIYLFIYHIVILQPNLAKINFNKISFYTTSANINSRKKSFFIKDFLRNLIFFIFICFFKVFVTIPALICLKTFLTLLSKFLSFFTNQLQNCSCFHCQLSANNQPVRRI